MEFSASSREVDDQLLVEVHGAVDITSAPRLRQQLVDAVNVGFSRLVLDLRDVDFIDFTGLGVLVGVLKRARAAGGYLQVVATSDAVTKPLRITGLHRVFNVCSSIESAVTAAVRAGTAARLTPRASDPPDIPEQNRTTVS